ncbi:amino acid/amide ABC transporter membrane protein 1 (HAAT family) [Herbinix hemicellulosilytica]|uniref:Putative membrane protein n=1 Tax=Herbinix hemicellulosilytica TaxID=1564487 RepID=A0A0H5SSS6_HERHM|nr:branched-chain amino acid ABC transporter permease [Herbinix hemicellulosilytica]RBP57814.1 amino acid/amide ABC transporter membrane protein 1 (HAAT family) [Herbinix hemicellulosilytica]CRZ33353.1 putative membrane protein [Herbinix hemicellulosilytica]
MNFLTHLLNGISLGSVYSIIALGYTMVYGIAKMINFAHGDVIMVGGFIIFTLMSTLGLNPFFSVLAAMIVCTLLGMTIERIAYKPLRKAPSLAVLITAIGVSYLLQNLALLIYGAESKSFTSVIPVKALSLFDGRLSISGETLVTIPLCIVIMIGLNFFIKKSKTGRGMIAVSEDKEAAVLMGVNVNKTIAITFAIGSAIAAIGSALMFSAYHNLSPTSGAMPGIKAFVAAVFGGIGSIPGAMIGGILLGVIEILSRAYISTQLGDAIVFLILIVVLLVKPTGILGRKIQEKV